MQAAISLDKASVTLDGRVRALDDVSVELPAGQIIGLIGPSGAGKTTLIRCLVGRQRLTSGQITVLGHPAGTAPIRPLLGYMPQSPASYGDLTVRQNLRYFATMQGLARRAVGAATTELLKTVDLTRQADQLVRTLSGGQRQRVSLALALIGRPKLLVLDEPTVGLDPVLREQLWQLFGRLAASGTTLVVSSHVMDEASRCDDLLLIRDGKLLAHGAPASLCERTHTTSVEAAFLKLVAA